jgi:hypothetical protein
MKFKTILLLLFAILLSHKSFTQSDSTQTDKKQKISTDFSLEINSSYFWRGAYNDRKPNIQPKFDIDFKNFELEFWGSSNFDNTYREFDYTLSYQLKSFKFAISDYYSSFSKSYSDYSINSPHLLDATILYSTGENNIFSLLISCMVWGDDTTKYYNSSIKNTQNYSNYIEASYEINTDKQKYAFCVGATLNNGMYANNLNVVNLGFTTEKPIEVSPKFSINPFFGLWCNPYNSNLLFNCGIRF